MSDLKANIESVDNYLNTIIKNNHITTENKAELANVILGYMGDCQDIQALKEKHERELSKAKLENYERGRLDQQENNKAYRLALLDEVISDFEREYNDLAERMADIKHGMKLDGWAEGYIEVADNIFKALVEQVHSKKVYTEEDMKFQRIACAEAALREMS